MQFSFKLRLEKRIKCHFKSLLFSVTKWMLLYYRHYSFCVVWRRKLSTNACWFSHHFWCPTEKTELLIEQDLEQDLHHWKILLCFWANNCLLIVIKSFQLWMFKRMLWNSCIIVKYFQKKKTNHPKILNPLFANWTHNLSEILHGSDFIIQ